jgi:hypothetical protein
MPTQLVLWLAVADIGTDIGYMLGDPDDGSTECIFQALCHVYFNDVIFLTTIVGSTREHSF